MPKSTQTDNILLFFNDVWTCAAEKWQRVAPFPAGTIPPDTGSAASGSTIAPGYPGPRAIHPSMSGQPRTACAGRSRRMAFLPVSSHNLFLSFFLCRGTGMGTCCQ